ncbi:transcriptional regulatory protein sir2b, putative [Plasmodium gallinaceum]|uniref:protein acetyllysine N-acetyltransferase n=1 Tax=Plasmodium gallinaceum TaxID=5849 RepID=A0A1J1GQ97_PLAGA|nr:transcriptional regulatory protein sir2b, putative [Plasmodium gallinaceum]CRG94709.1 transcriptional regulatory protein sir2b, putative [Plasmodium gallinaceum]
MNYALRLSKNEYKGPLGEKEYFEDVEEEKKKIKELIEKIKTSNYIVVHAGAGISTSCGLQDFRGPTGIWTNEFLKEVKNKKKKQKQKKKCLEVKYDSSSNSSINYSINKKEKSDINFIKNEKKKKLDTNIKCEKDSEDNLDENISFTNVQDNAENLLNNNSKLLLNNDNLISKKRHNENCNINNLCENSKNTQLKETILNIKKEDPLEKFNKNKGSSDEEKIKIKKVHNDDNESNVTNFLSSEKFVIFGKRKKKVIDLHLALPSKTHIMIKELMNKNIIKFLITQNIDSLHYRCGTKFSKIAEIHGNIFIERCDFCGRRYLRDFVIPTISFKPTGSLCFLCSFPPVGICTDVLLDWNNSYEDFFHHNSIKHSQKADFHFCLGSSFYIVPASYYPSKKKFANKNSYSCLINYQKSFLSKEVNLNLHSNVNNVSDIIIKEFSLNPLSIRNAKIVIVRCQLSNFDLLYDNIITIKNMEKNSYKSEISKKKNNNYNENNSENEETENFSFTNMENNLNEEIHLNNGEDDLNKKKEINNTINNESHHNIFNNGQKNNNTFKEQIFLIKCSMIKNIKTVSTDSIYEVSIKKLDRIKGIWLIKSKSTCLLEVELWYNSFILLKLICSGYSSFIELNTWNVHVAYTYGDDIDDMDEGNNNKENFKNFNLYKNKYINDKSTEQFYENNSNKIENTDQRLLNDKNVKLNNNNINHDNSNSYDNFSGNLENYYISEILNEHVHVGYNPNNFLAESKVELLAILSRENLFKNECYMPFELPNSFKLLYNLFCIINKYNEEKISYTQNENNDKYEIFIKNFNLSKELNFYTNDFINSFIKKETYTNNNRYKFRERKKRKLFDYSSCSDENEEKRTFIFYDLYMSENKQTHKIKINKELVKNNLDNNNSLGDSYSYENNALRENNNLMKNVEIKKLIKINTKNDIEYTNTSKVRTIETCERKSHTKNCSSENEDNINNYDNVIGNKNYENNDNNMYNNENKVNHNKYSDEYIIKNDLNEQMILDEDIKGNNSVRKKLHKENFEANSNISDNKIDKYYIENYTNKENELKDNNFNSQLLFCPTIFINNKHKLGELVTRVPKYIKPKRIYTPYKKIKKDKRFSNTLQKCRYEIWQKKYNEIINNIDEEHMIDSTLYKELCYLPLWILNYVNDLFECL